jgi:DNA-binding MarR family transcriptional regulator
MLSQGASTTVEKETIQHLLWALKPLGAIPFPFITTFLAIVHEEGQTQSAYARGAGLHRYTMSRYIHALSDHGQNGAAGLGLVRLEPDPDKMHNSHRIYLTAKGRAIAAEIFRNLKRHQRAMVA